MSEAKIVIFRLPSDELKLLDAFVQESRTTRTQVLRQLIRGLSKSLPRVQQANAKRLARVLAAEDEHAA